MYLDESRYPRWRCNGIIIDNITGNRCCNGREITARRESFFSNKKISVRQVMAILYGWSLQMRISRIADFAQCTIDTVKRTILDWYQMIQEDIQENDCVIGGIDAEGNPIVVEIDESKFGKRKYNRGHHVEGKLPFNTPCIIIVTQFYLIRCLGSRWCGTNR